MDQNIDPLEQREQERAAPTVADMIDRYEREHLPRKAARWHNEDRALARYVAGELAGIREALAATPERRGLEAHISRRLAALTPREREVLEQLVLGRPNKAIARALGIGPRTVEIHRAPVMEKMQAGSLSQLVRMAFVAGLDPDAG